MVAEDCELMSSDFPVVPTTIDTSSEQFSKCRDDWNDVLSKHEKAVQCCVNEGQDKYVKRHIERGMLLSTCLIISALIAQLETG